MSSHTWVLESDVFEERHARLRAAVAEAGGVVVDWRDEWRSTSIPDHLHSTRVVFHGSLDNATWVHEHTDWSPGSFCPVDRFGCAAWYQSARPFLVHEAWEHTTVEKLVDAPRAVADRIGANDRVFIRPDSPLKPFSGRVVAVDSIDLAALDHGFYYDDVSLPIVVAPVRWIGHEWRFVIARGTVVAGSRYDASTRSSVADSPSSDAHAFAEAVTSEIPAPADVYVLDVCEADGALRLLELNPFGGADLYACDVHPIVAAIHHDE